MQHFRIRNWSSFQSYKDRKPPWIRFHKTLLDNYEYQTMSANGRALLPMLWLLASEDSDPVSGSLRIGYEKIAFRLRLSVKDVKAGIAEAIAHGFIEEISECYESVTGPLQDRHETVIPETEKETENPLTPFPDWFPLNDWNDFVEFRKSIKAPMTERAKEIAIAELTKLRDKGHDPSSVIRQSIYRGWKGLFAMKADDSKITTKPRITANTL